MKTASAKPLVSVCIPCYNGEHFITGTVESVLAQSFTEFELVIIDDASTDQTLTKLERFTDPRIRLSRNTQNLGMGQNWNNSVSRARGKYVKLLCGDDLLEPQCLARQVAALESPSNSRAVLAVCGRKIINHEGNVIFRRRVPFSSGLVAGQKLIRASLRCGTNLIGEPVVGLFRREVLGENTRYDSSNRYLIDLAFWTSILRHGDVFVERDCLAAFRISRTAVSAQIGFGQARAFRNFIRQLHLDPFYRISRLDIALGYGFSFQWCILRNLFVWLATGGRRLRSRSDSFPVQYSGQGEACRLSSKNCSDISRPRSESGAPSPQQTAKPSLLC